MKINFTLSPAIVGKYEIIDTMDPIYHHKLGKFDFRDITEEEAKLLVDAGSIYIRAVKTTKKQIMQ